MAGTVAVAVLAIGSVAPALAQTTLVLGAPDTQVTDTTIRGGTYASKNFDNSVLVTRASDSDEYDRRALLKFDTQNTIPQGSAITSATLTVRVKDGGTDISRNIGAYRVTTSFEEAQATWRVRKAGTNWSRAGGDLGTMYASAHASNAAGSAVTFDVTRLVQDAVNGEFGSRYTRVALIDLDASTRDSYREYHHSETADASLRPVLTVTYGGSSSTTSTSSTSGTLRVLHWNIHHGVGTDGKYNIDRLATWIAKFNPDVVSLNEVERYTGWGNEDQPARFASLLKTKTGKTWHYHFAQRDGSAKGQGNLILSVIAFNSKGDFLLSYRRSIAQVGLTVNGRSVNVFSTHLDADSSTYRATQISELTGWASMFAEGRIVAGDFNAQPGTANIAAMTTAHVDAWAQAKSLGVAVAYPDNPNGNTRNTRIDYVFYSKGATRLVVKQAQVFDTRGANGVRPSDHHPLMVTFEVR
jgi:endonuclease/exonuclease/phosphatase family metal-dependent hydrolase